MQRKIKLTVVTSLITATNEVLLVKYYQAYLYSQAWIINVHACMYAWIINIKYYYLLMQLEQSMHKGKTKAMISALFRITFERQSFKLKDGWFGIQSSLDGSRIHVDTFCAPKSSGCNIQFLKSMLYMWFPIGDLEPSLVFSVCYMQVSICNTGIVHFKETSLKSFKTNYGCFALLISRHGDVTYITSFYYLL